MNELIVIEPTDVLPTVPDDWDYDTSVEKTKTFFYKWKNLTNDILDELWIAREMLSKEGNPVGTNQYGTGIKVPVPTWSDYCEGIGTSRQVINRWLKDHFEYRTMTTPNQLKLDENIETDHECPSCGYEW